MFGKKKKVPVPTYDVTQKIKKTWWGGTKLIPTTKSEQRKLKAEILKRNPNAIVLDSKAKKEKELEWIDRIEDWRPLATVKFRGTFHNLRNFSYQSFYQNYDETLYTS